MSTPKNIAPKFSGIAPYFTKSEIIACSTLFKGNNIALDAERSNELILNEYSRYGMTSKKLGSESGRSISPSASHK